MISAMRLMRSVMKNLLMVSLSNHERLSIQAPS